MLIMSSCFPDGFSVRACFLVCRWVSCSPDVDRVLAHDVMHTVKRLVADLLSFHPVLLYQGQYDAECGVASNEAWIHSMKW